MDLMKVPRDKSKIGTRGASTWELSVLKRLTGLVQTAMSLPPETLDIIIDNLHDEPTTLKACCLVSKSWVPRTRSHLFARVVFDGSPGSRILRWKKTFPDPSNSPAHHTRTLFVCNLRTPTTADTDVTGWIHTFCNVIRLEFMFVDRAALGPFYGLSSTIRSLHLSDSTAGVSDFICSFPLLEDLLLMDLSPESGAYEWDAPSTSPKLTGFLDLRTPGVTCPVTRQLLNLPGGLRFSKIHVKFDDDTEAEAVKKLVLACSDTLESLTTLCRASCAFPSASITNKYLTAIRRYGHTQTNSP